MNTFLVDPIKNFVLENCILDTNFSIATTQVSSGFIAESVRNIHLVHAMTQNYDCTMRNAFLHNLDLKKTGVFTRFITTTPERKRPIDTFSVLEI